MIELAQDVHSDSSCSLRRFFADMELTHLRAQVADLTDRLQAAEGALNDARAEVAMAQESADVWRTQLTNVIAQAREMLGSPPDLRDVVDEGVLLTAKAVPPKGEFGGVDIDRVQARRRGAQCSGQEVSA